MNCRKARDLFSGYLEDWLSNEERKELGTHIDNCGKCAALFVQFQESVSLVHSLPRIPMPSSFPERVRQAALAGEKIKQQEGLFSFGHYLRMAGAFAAIAIAVFLVARGPYVSRLSRELPVVVQTPVTGRVAPLVASATPAYPRVETASFSSQEDEFVLDDWVMSDGGARPESTVPHDGGEESFVSF